MRTAFLCLCVLGLTMVVNGQDAVAPPLAPDTTLFTSTMQVGAGPTVAKNVEIHVGSTVVTADEAEIRYGVAPGKPDEVDLRGNVRMKTTTKLQVEYK
jgi:lipopolysaccharide export system protein LptA